MLKTKIVSSLENVFLDGSFDELQEITRITALKNERFSFQCVCYMNDAGDPITQLMVPKLGGELAKYATVREVRSVPVSIPIVPGTDPDNYLRSTPGLYPDLLSEPVYDGEISIVKAQLKALWIDLDLRRACDGINAGESKLKLSLTYNGDVSCSAEITVEILDAILPKQELILTQWFHCDCIANYYHCDVWSEKHWEYVEKFAKVARKNGINLLLTPLLTPSLDTKVGGERLTTQLLGITKKGDEYEFDFTLLDRWIDMCDRVGIEYFEISHFFTQWGAEHAPKVMAWVDGEYKRIFGWETEATGEEYVTFLRAMITAFLDHMKARGDDKRCFFHISDEPSQEQLPSYKAAKESIADLLQDYTIMDALSSYEFYTQGIVKTPIPCNSHIGPFIEGEVPGLWTYYCSGQWKDVSNRFLSMPSYRNRSIGVHMYKYDIVGFLQWGFNFYNTRQSYRSLDPYGDSCGHDWVPAGDTYSVYPGEDGNALESLRIVVFYDAIQDIGAMKLAESFVGKEKVVEAIENAFGGRIAFDVCARSVAQMQAVRDAVNDIIRQNTV